MQPSDPHETLTTPSRLRRPGWLVRLLEAGVVLWVALVLSLLAHGLLIHTFYQAHLGEVDTTALQHSPRFVAIQRATWDFTLDASTTTQDAPQADAGVPVQQTADELLDLHEESLREAVMDIDEAQTVIESFTPPMSLEAPASLDLPVEQIEIAPLPTYSFTGYETGAGETPGLGDAGEYARRLLDGPMAGAGNGGAGSSAAARSGADLLEIEAFVPAREGSAVDPLTAAPPMTAMDLPAFVDPVDGPLVMPQLLDDDFTYRITRFERRGEPGWFRADILPQASLARLTAMPKDVVFMLDISASISQDWVNQSVRGIYMALASLNAEDRFNIVLFSDRIRVMNPQGLLAATQESITQAARFLRDVRPAGSTDVNAALSYLLDRREPGDRVSYIILISDGVPTVGVTDTRNLINLVTRDNDGRASIYTVVIGDQRNVALMEFLSYRNKGLNVVVDDFPRTAPAITGLLSRLRYPLIKDLNVHVVGESIDQVVPRQLPNIHAGESSAIFGRYATAGAFTMHVTGQSGTRPVSFTFRRDLRQAETGSEEMPREWAFWKLHDLYSDMLRDGETPALRREVEQLRRTYRLQSVY